jgi:hypothetical protein
MRLNESALLLSIFIGREIEMFVKKKVRKKAMHACNLPLKHSMVNAAADE